MMNETTDFCRKTVNARWFHHLVIFTIIIAGVLAGIETNPAAVATHGFWLQILDRIVLGVFIVEAIFKLTAHCPRPWDYFRDGWNIFDFTVVVLCLIPMESQFAVVLRLGRTLRLLRLVSALPKLQLLVGALVKSFSSMGYVGLLLGLMFYIYAITGVQLFGRHSPEHFGNLSAAFLTLFQTITLDDWRNLFASASGSSPAMAAIYFVSFILLGTMIMLNLFIGIIMNSMSEMHAELDADNAAKQVTDDKPSVQDELAAMDAQLAEMRIQLAKFRQKLPSRNI